MNVINLLIIKKYFCYTKDLHYFYKKGEKDHFCYIDNDNYL